MSLVFQTILWHFICQNKTILFIYNLRIHIPSILFEVSIDKKLYSTLIHNWYWSLIFKFNNFCI